MEMLEKRDRNFPSKEKLERNQLRMMRRAAQCQEPSSGNLERERLYQKLGKVGKTLSWPDTGECKLVGICG